MMIVVSNPTEIVNEISLVNQLFDEGLRLFHLRKPDYSASETKLFLQKINPEYYSKIALHYYHEIASEFGIKRLHFPEINRKETNEIIFSELKGAGNYLSSSIHTINEYNSVSSYFNYTFFGTVFNSISKGNYKSVLSTNFLLPKMNKGTKIIAIGGIDESNLEKALDMGFDGIAVLGAIWQKPETGINKFKQLQKICNRIGQSH